MSAKRCARMNEHGVECGVLLVSDGEWWSCPLHGHITQHGLASDPENKLCVFTPKSGDPFKDCIAVGRRCPTCKRYICERHYPAHTFEQHPVHDDDIDDPSEENMALMERMDDEQRQDYDE